MAIKKAELIERYVLCYVGVPAPGNDIVKAIMNKSPETDAELITEEEASELRYDDDFEEFENELHEEMLGNTEGGNKMIYLSMNILKKIVEHNQMQMFKAEGDQSQAQDLYTIEHGGMAIYDFFASENLMEDVNPVEYYPLDKLRNVETKWLQRKVK